jgi:hypothetical protein
MAKMDNYRLSTDKRGATWDTLLYVPVVLLLGSYAAKTWYSGDQTLAYILVFLATFIFLIGANRILGTRLMLLPASPRELELASKSVAVTVKGGERIELVKDLHYYPDYAGKSFGLVGMDLSGKKRQFVFHRGQFARENDFKDIRSHLAIYK